MSRSALGGTTARKVGAMRRQVVIALAVSAFGSIARELDAQALVTLSGGPTLPFGDYGVEAHAGYAGFMGILFDTGTPSLSAGVQVMYGSNARQPADIFAFASMSSKSNTTNAEVHRTQLLAALGSVAYRFGDAGKSGAFVVGSTGMVRRFDTDGPYSKYASGLGFGMSLVFEFPRSHFSVLASWGFLTADTSNGRVSLFPASVGIGIPIPRM